MTAYWQGRLPTAAVVGADGRARSRGPAAPHGSLAVGRYMGTVIVTLHGDLHLRASAALADAFRDLIDGQGNLAIVVDLGDVDGIDRYGVNVLASAATRMAERGGALRLSGPTNAVFAVLSRAGLAHLVTIPAEQSHRPQPRTPSANAVRRKSINAHPAGAGAGSSRLDLTVAIRGDQAQVGLVGELVAGTAPDLLERVLRLADDGARTIVIDLGGVDVVDTHGMAALASAATLLRHLKGEMILESPTPCVLELLHAEELGARFIIR